MEQQSKDKMDQNLSITIKTPSGDWPATFAKTTKIHDVINAVVKQFSYAQNGKYELVAQINPDETLKPERTLVSYGIKDEDLLVFIDHGIAV